MKLSDSDLNLPTMLFGTVSGVIGVVATLPADLYQFLAKVQNNLTKVIKGVGGFSHEQYPTSCLSHGNFSRWRSFATERKTSEAKNFIDGDLIESFLELKPDKMREVVKGLDISVEELVKKIESLAQALH
jgi:DNA damage-binding protein 1